MDAGEVLCQISFHALSFFCVFLPGQRRISLYVKDVGFADTFANDAV